MSLKKCPGCEATVDASKAYCPDCGAAMDEEIHRTDSSEFDSMMRTQNINKTAQLRMLEEFNLSGVFNLPKETDETAAFENVRQTPAPPIARQEPQFDPSKTQTIVLKPQNDFPAAMPKSAEVVSNSNKKLFIALGAGIGFFVLVLIGVIILGLLYWFYLR